jgi:hypothetical protein
MGGVDGFADVRIRPPMPPRASSLRVQRSARGVPPLCTGARLAQLEQAPDRGRDRNRQVAGRQPVQLGQLSRATSRQRWLGDGAFRSSIFLRAKAVVLTVGEIVPLRAMVDHEGNTEFRGPRPLGMTDLSFPVWEVKRQDGGCECDC